MKFIRDLIDEILEISGSTTPEFKVDTKIFAWGWDKSDSKKVGQVGFVKVSHIRSTVKFRLVQIYILSR